MPTPAKITDLLKKLPSTPGVYEMLDKNGKVIYIGKAKVLKNRVRSYWQKSAEQSPKTARLIAEAVDLRWTPTANEVDALNLEANLVREHLPKYNVLLRDDKHFLYFKVTTQEEYPRVLTTRKVLRDGARYFGPKTSATAVRDTLKLIQKLFNLRQCELVIKGEGASVEVTKVTQKYPCLYAQIGQCGAPCVGRVSRAEYAESAQAVLDFLGGQTQKIELALKAAMAAAAEARQYEKAASLRDKLRSLESIMQKQVVSDVSLASRDVVGLVLDGDKAYAAVLTVREGRLIDQKQLELTARESSLPEVCAELVRQYYALATEIPREIVLPVAPEEVEPLSVWLAETAGHRVQLLVPERGEKVALRDLAEKSAAAYRVQNKARYENASERTVLAAEELQKALGLPKALKRIEAYDISHLGGQATVGSMVVLESGEPKSAHYRQFRLRSLAAGEIDDYASMAEVLRRRLAYLVPQLPEGVQLRKLNKKKDWEKLEKIWQEAYGMSKRDNAAENFLVAEKAKEIVATAELVRNSKFLCLESLWVKPALRGQRLGHALLRKLLASTKEAKVYLNCHKDLLSYYAELGFVELKQVPAELAEWLAEWCEEAGKDAKEYIGMVYARRERPSDQSFAAKPELIVLDGGKGQLSSVLKSVVLPTGTAVVGLAKREEELWRVKDAKAKKWEYEKIVLPKDSKALYLLQRIRDEAHRTANDLRKSVLKGAATESELDTLPGVGAATRQKLLKKYGSLAAVREATESELAELLGRVQARLVYAALH